MDAAAIHILLVADNVYAYYWLEKCISLVAEAIYGQFLR